MGNTLVENSDGTTFTDVSAQGIFNQTAYEGDGNIEDITGTATASTGESGSFVSNDNNDAIIITYTDGDSKVHTLEVTNDAVMVSKVVKDPSTPTNNAPVAVGTMADIVATEGDTNPTIDPSNYFTDADSDTLTYTITTARTDGSDSFTETLDQWHSATGGLDADDVGDWVVTITANDGNGGTAKQSFSMTVN